MKTYLSHFMMLSVFFVSTFSALAQNEAKKSEQTEYAIKKKQTADSKAQLLSAEDVSKSQTKNLQTLLNLDDKQTSRVYDICLAVEKEMRAISAKDQDTKMSEINALERAKDEKLKETLTEEQFSMYMKSVKNDKK